MTFDTKPDIPAAILARWQRTVDLLGQITNTPVALITRVHEQDIEMFVRSTSPLSPYGAHEKHPRQCGLYCDWVIEQQKSLLVCNAEQDGQWADNPDLAHDLSFYCGYPLNWPDNEPFGTLCVLDDKDNSQAKHYRALLEEFQLLLEGDLAFVAMQQQQSESTSKLQRSVAEYKQSVQNKADDLQEMTAAMRVLLNQREGNKQALQAQALSNVEELLNPWLHKLQQTALDEEQQSYLRQLQQQLRQPPCSDLARHAYLTPMERQVASAIAQGHSSKVIAHQMHLGKSTIDFHRRNIRKKLGLQRSGTPLKQALFEPS